MKSRTEEKPDLLWMRPGVQFAQSFTRWCCGTVRYAVTEETLLSSDIVRRFLGNVTFGWDELSVNTRWQKITDFMQEV